VFGKYILYFLKSNIDFLYFQTFLPNRQFNIKLGFLSFNLETLKSIIIRVWLFLRPSTALFHRTFPPHFLSRPTCRTLHPTQGFVLLERFCSIRAVQGFVLFERYRFYSIRAVQGFVLFERYRFYSIRAVLFY
jgi:hypothetical protein